MEEVCRILDRKANTVRKWEREGRLPKRLVPKRGERQRRYWTQTQVDGLLKWMITNDMRPGRLVTDPANEQRHIANLRRPKYLNGDTIRGVREMAAHGRSREYILKKTFPRTKYATTASLERALQQVAKQQGWELPAPAHKIK
jgi:hypothetical protein